jgi:GlpG protein
MRQLGTLQDEGQARRLADYLLTLGIPTQLNRETHGWDVWVRHEDQLARAREEWRSFVAQPDDPRYQSAASRAREIEKAKREADRAFEKRFRSAGDIWDRPALQRSPVTAVVMGICVLLAVLTSLGATRGPVVNGREWPLLDYLVFTAPEDRPVADIVAELFEEQRRGERGPIDLRSAIAEKRRADDGLAGLRRGQVWRLITPVFIHFGIMHLLFNLYAFYNLGGVLEAVRGSRWLLVFFILSGIASNVCQYVADYATGGALNWFGGLSGVLYALFGYLWMRSRYSPLPGIHLHPDVVIMMIIWLFLCMTGALGQIANTAHVSGLLFGMAVGIAPYLLRRWRER